MKNLKYHFKYLLYESPSARFTQNEAHILLNDLREQDLLFKDISTRSQSYRNKLEVNLKTHKELLSKVLVRLNALPPPKYKKHNVKLNKNNKNNKNKSTSPLMSPKGNLHSLTPYSSITIFQGGSPGLGRRK